MMLLAELYRVRILSVFKHSYRSAIDRYYSADAAQSTQDRPNPYLLNTHWTDASELAGHLFKRIVAVNEHFVIVDKPAGLSVWGHALSKLEALKLLRPKCETDGVPLSIKDCLPYLCKLINDASSTGTFSQNPVYTFSHLPDGINPPTSPSSTIPKLYIAESLPASYSGLILLGRTEEYSTAAQKFYRAALKGKPPWRMYQQFLAVCLNKPFTLCADNVRFPIGTFALNEHLHVGYRLPEGTPRRPKADGTVVLQKYVSHRSLIPNTMKSSLIELQTNSTFRGLPELYLLHEGCAVVGELLQSSRLVDTGIAPVVLQPSQTKLNSEPPLWLRRLLGHPSFYDLPVHIHRTKLYIPAPIFYKSDKTNPIHFTSILPTPRGQICSSGQKTSSSFAGLSWTKLEDSEGVSSKPSYVLTCTSPWLPEYFPYTMERLGLKFDYTSWISSGAQSAH
ncbi:hypothetical protein CRM22_003724 [Opisthorchis felineus]|uniref:Uncharacterized protein n=1 Tax=Opisthorchis felineus TaxID=147828 RepID=A0A4S2M0K3_OPIFE|nr:hypothetical protein CRM22_003724 [Opisthorchis felineus]